MKKLASILIFLVYINTAFALSIQTHYCMGLGVEENKCCCEKTETKKDCCTDVIKICSTDSHTTAQPTLLPASNAMEIIHLQYILFESDVLSFIPKNLLKDYNRHFLVSEHQLPLFILHRVYRV